MNSIDDEKAILEEKPDFDRQIEILNEEHKETIKKRKWYFLIIGLFLSIVLIFIVSYSTLYTYIKYDEKGSSNNTDIYIKDDTSGGVTKEEKPSKDKKPNINVTDENETGNKIKPVYNVDYINNRKGTFNIDIYGNKAKIFNESPQLDPTKTYCILNCDSDDDGWADYNIDLNGDGVADINIVLDPKNSKKCDLNCDLNLDTIPDTNIDIDGDYKPDINITNGSNNIPIKNIDYMGNRKAIFNVEVNGEITNKVNDATNNKTCTSNCDLDGDGWPDYNIKLPSSDVILNEKIKDNNKTIEYKRGKTVDWKCYKSSTITKICSSGNVESNQYINIDINGDGIPDINLSNDKGNTINNKINKEVIINNKKVILNEDLDNDGFPDINIDVDNDGKPELNITDNISNVCIKNCDTNNDGKPDYLIDIDGKGNNLITISNLNVDYDYDTKYEINIDTNYDLYPDLNIDLDGDKVPDINIDYNHDGIADTNVDLDGDGKPDVNLDPYGIGKCVFNCNNNGVLSNIVDNSDTCNLNCDTDNDGWPNKLIDLDNDGKCDLNCDAIDDKNLDYYKDTEYSIVKTKINEDDTSINDVTVLNGIDINAQITELQSSDSWSKNYVITLTNDTNYAIDYQLKWINVSNTFTSSNMKYYVTKSCVSYLEDATLPLSDISLDKKLTLRKKTTIKFVAHIYMYNQPYNQVEDAGKVFAGKLIIDVNE